MNDPLEENETASEEVFLEYNQWMELLDRYEPFKEFRRFAERMKNERIPILMRSTGERPPMSPTDEYLKGAIIGIMLPFEAMSNTMVQARDILRKREEENE